jgi:hypothetical protein
VWHGLGTSSVAKRKSRPDGGFFFLYSIKLRIAGSEEKTANFVGVEVLIYEGLLLWISGGNLTKKAGERRLPEKRFAKHV